MSKRQNLIIERFFTALISGDRIEARNVIGEVIDDGCDTEQILADLFWPTLQHLQTLHRNDQLSQLCYHYGTRLLRGLVDQMQMRLSQSPRNGEKIMVVCGPEESEELAAQMTSDLLEAAGWSVYFAGGGIANDEIVDQITDLGADRLVIFGAVPATVPGTRQLIDRLHDMGLCPNLQIIVGGGVFNRADGLAEEIGADLWAGNPQDLVELIEDQPGRRMTADQRTVGGRRQSGGRKKRRVAA